VIVRQFYPVLLTVDGEEIALRIKRMSMEEHSDFRNDFAKFGTPTLARFASRESSGPEQEKNEKGEYVMPFEAVAAKRLSEMTPEKRAEYEKAVDSDEAAAKAFLTSTFERFVTVERGLLEELPDGTQQAVTLGLDLLRLFGARNDVIHQVMSAVRTENELDASAKKNSPSPSDSSNFSGEPSPDRVGPKPETTVSPAATEASVETEDATKSRPTPSGSMDPTSSIPAQFSR
jgi:hypothetical protein